jgi:hypothetical protein
MKRFALAVPLIAVVVAAAPAAAGTKYETSLVPLMAGELPGFAATGSSIKIDDHLRLKGTLKKVVDSSGARVTTDGVPSGDDYRVEVDVGIASGTTATTITVAFDVKNGNGTFQADLSGDPVLASAQSGDGIAVNGVRVRNGAGTLLGVGGFARK